MTSRDIQHHLARTIGTELSHETISKITDAAPEEVGEWQSRPLEEIYPIIYLEALTVKVRDGHHVRERSAHIAVGIDLDGVKHVLGIWVQASEGTKFWAGVCAELRNPRDPRRADRVLQRADRVPRGDRGHLGRGHRAACTVHVIRAAMRFVSYSDRKKVVAALRPIYTAPTANAAALAPEGFAESDLRDKYPAALAEPSGSSERSNTPPDRLTAQSTGGGASLALQVASSPTSGLVASMRPKQWIKNLLVVAVPLAAGQILDAGVIAKTLLAFVAMCAASASVYLTNDLLDRDADRRHPTKRDMPIAAGQVSVPVASMTAVLLALTALIVPALLGSPELSLLVLAYLLLQVVYVFWAKHQPVLDLVCVAAGFVLRAVAGGVAVGLPTSTWFLTVTAASAMFVVAGKRYSELVTQGHEGGTRQGLQEYSEGYLRFVWGVSVGIAVVFYGLWAAEFGNGGSAMWARLSVIPFVLLLLQYARDVDSGTAEAPEDLVWGDRVLQALGVIWVAMFLLQVFA